MKKILIIILASISTAVFAQEVITVEHTGENSTVSVEVQIDIPQNRMFDPNDSTTIQLQAMEIDRLNRENEILRQNELELKRENGVLLTQQDQLLESNAAMAAILFELRDSNIQIMKILLPDMEFFLNDMLERIDEGLARRIEVE